MQKKGLRHLPKTIRLLYEDDDLLAITKPEGLLTIASEKESQKTAYYIMTGYVRKGVSKSRKRIFIVHRLDRDTSGLLLLAKNFKAKAHLQDNWQKITKTYLAMVKGVPEKESGVLKDYLAENSRHIMYVSEKKRGLREAVTRYRVLASRKGESLLELELVTGLKNQIRVQLANQGLPIIGDTKYGHKKKGKNHMALHSYRITLKHPVTRKKMTLESEPPPLFNKLLKPPRKTANEKI